MKLLNVGFGNMVSAGRIVAVIAPDSAPVKRMVQKPVTAAIWWTPRRGGAPGPCS